MKNILYLIIVVVLAGCKDASTNDDTFNPRYTTEPEKVIKFDISYYGEIIDSGYYKLWSDSSWSKFRTKQIINGITYYIVEENDGSKYYYDAAGYAGFQPKGESVILFDKSLSSLPDSMAFNVFHKRETTFFYQGYTYKLEQNTKLMDTSQIITTLGLFNSVIHLYTIATISVSSQSETYFSDSWIAIEPGAIRIKNSDGKTIQFIKGFVNGKSWGGYTPQHTLFYQNNSRNFIEQMQKGFSIGF